MKSSALGKNTSKVEIVNVSMNGIWIYVQGKEYFLPYKNYPWFKEAQISQIHNVKLSRSGNLHWPDLDVDLEIESLIHPEKYPLVYK